jgi:hypothetical protein
VARRVIAYKFLRAGAVGPFSGFRWEPGTWVEAEGLEECRTGVHACRTHDLPVWLDVELWEIELAGRIVEAERKVVAERAQLMRRVESWTSALAREFGRFCSHRTRERVGYVPVLAGFVADVDRFVAQGRIPIAGFAAARAAELHDGPGAYDEERRAQADWLADRLGLQS